MQIIDENGNADWYSYDPYGQTISEPASPKYNPFRYKGAYQDIVNGKELYYMTFRYYDPKYGRFTQIDPIKLMSEFIFGANNPIMFGDPSGLCVESNANERGNHCDKDGEFYWEWAESLDGSGITAQKVRVESTFPYDQMYSIPGFPVITVPSGLIELLPYAPEEAEAVTIAGIVFIEAGLSPERLRCVLLHERVHVLQFWEDPWQLRLNEAEAYAFQYKQPGCEPKR